MPRSDRRQFVLAIDLGSSGPKVALVADDGEMVAHARERVETFFLPGGGAEQDPDAMVAGLHRRRPQGAWKSPVRRPKT